MKHIFLICLLVFPMIAVAQNSHDAFQSRYAEAAKEFGNGNYKDALEKYRALLYSRETSAKEAAECFAKACDCLVKLRRIDDEIDEMSERALKAHDGHWRVAQAVALRISGGINHGGHLADGRFHRGYRRISGGEWKNVFQRDRAYSLKLLADAMQVMEADSNASRGDRHAFYSLMLDCLLKDFSDSFWKLQILTNLEKEPEWDYGNADDWSSSGAPVDENGQPVFYKTPLNWHDAANDGERFRWLLAAIARNGYKDEAAYGYAKFLCSQFDISALYLNNDNDLVKRLL